MLYSSSSASPKGRVSLNKMAAGVETEFCLTGGVAVAEFSAEPDFTPSADPSARTNKAKAATAGAGCPGTEYWLP
jgi:hypothetical protein